MSCIAIAAFNLDFFDALHFHNSIFVITFILIFIIPIHHPSFLLVILFLQVIPLQRSAFRTFTFNVFSNNHQRREYFLPHKLQQILLMFRE